MKKIQITFEKGGCLTGWLDENKAPETVTALWSSLPCETVCKHTRWCGREIYGSIKTGAIPARENNTSTVSKFDISYWREDWDVTTGKTPEEAGETMGFYHGPEYLKYAGGTLSLNVIGRIVWEDEKTLDEVGERIWKQGFEKMKIEKA